MQVDAGSISGQSQKTIIWVLRGDEGGSYQPAIDYLGILNPFGTEIKDTAVLKDPIQVEDPSKLVLKTFAPDLIYRNQPFDMLFELVNTGNKPFYDAYLQIDEVEILDETLVLLSNIPDLIVRKESLQPGEKISLAVKFMPLISGVCCNKELVQSGGNVKFSSTIIPDCPHFVKAYEEQEGITLKWVQAANGLYYIIRRRLAGEEDFKVINSAVFGESFTDTNVEDFKTYEYTVSTVNWDGEESMTVSEIVKATAGKITTDPDQGQHNTPIKVSLFTGTSNLPIYYTTDGTDPVPGTSPLYSGPISVDQLTLIKAVAVNGDAVSRVFEFKFYIGTVLRGDFVEGYWSDCGTNEAERENLGDKYRLALSDLLIYDWTQDPPPGYLREMPSNSWTAETIVKLENFIDGSQFASGILVTQGDEVISWGYYEGANLGLTNRNHKPIKISYGETQVRLRLRKERNILYFEYRGSTDEPWRLGGSRILTDEPVKAGVYSRTWSKPQPLQTEYIGFMVIEKPEMDQAWEWRQPVEGPSYQVTAKNAFIMTVPDSRTFRQNKSRDYAPQIIRKDITGMNWRFSALQEVIENSEDSFFTGLMVTLPDYDRIYFGCEGNELVVRRSTKMLFNVTLNSAEPLELLIERQGTRFIFSYRLQSDGSWLVLGKTDLTLPVVEIGMVTRTDAPQNVVAQFSNIMVEQTTEDLDQQWTWDSGTPGTSYQVLGKDSIAVNVSDVTYFDDSNQDHLTSGLRQAVGDIDWSIATEVSMIDLKNEEHYLAGIQVLLSATDIISWGITDSGLRLERGNIGIADFSGVQLPVNLRVRKTGSLINFEYLDTTNETWNTAYVFEAPIIPIRIGVAVKTATATFCNAVFNELRFKRLLPAGWEWYTPISGPEYRIESDNQISLRLPGDKAYPFTLTKDHAPQLRKDPAQLDLTGDWSLSAIATLREFTSGVVFRSRLMVYFSPDQILQWGFYNGTSLRGDWEKKVAGVENNATTVELRIRKVGDVYNLEYRYSEGDPWTLAGKTMITETPQKVGWIVSSNRATSVVTEIQLPKLKQNIAKYPVNIRVINEKWGTPIWNALIKLNGETLVQYGLGCTAVLPAGSHPVTVTAPGYLDYQGIIEITQAVNLEIKLKPEIELPEVRIVGINPAFDVTTGELRVNAEILAGGSDSILWLRISLLDGSNQVLASLKGQVFARAGEFIQIKPEDWVFVLGEQPSRIRLEVLSGDDPETVLTVGDVMMNE
ncbi:MAG: PEGA domain-containing protein [Firmicutes bacterium]|nr:PEGA domain-containing protein [Bacillota bacterium]